MQMEVEPQVVLNSGRRMPVLGMGTATYPVPPDETITTAVIDAIGLGYRHLDTASVYGSERAVGRAIATALERGLIGSRDELFVTTKLWCTDMHADRVVPALQESLRTLGLEYIDLYLIHYPVRLKGEKRMVFTGEDMIPLDMPTVWEAMEKCQSLGLAKSIGVSNFTCKKLADLLNHARIPPAVNQVEVNPIWQQRKLRDFCSEKGIHVSAYSPLGAVGVLWGSNEVMECEEVKRIAQSMGKSIAQVCLRWGVEQGVSVVVKSFNGERLKENMQIFDWHLKEEDKERLSLVPQKRLILVEPFISPTGFYKSHAEFWDGDV
ncbi:non-functional NADPH-dependent codeinone reductase 2-like [Musa acuminata AAA Group]|uniref:non-functional NADPH-dependent codeinone reductase 2-like n=1 Tax=Musa acuminata AAA Group TaxID=214697 RepID=UPI0031DF9ADD